MSAYTRETDLNKPWESFFVVFQNVHFVSAVNQMKWPELNGVF